MTGIRPLSKRILARRSDGAKVVYAFGPGKLMIEDADGRIVNDDSGRPFIFGSLSAANDWLRAEGGGATVRIRSANGAPEGD